MPEFSATMTDPEFAEALLLRKERILRALLGEGASHHTASETFQEGWRSK